MRRRVVIYGSRSGELPELTHLEAISGKVTAWDAIADLPNPQDALRRFSRGEAVPYRTEAQNEYVRSLRGGARRVTRWEPVMHSAKIVRAYSRVRQGGTDPDTKCWRLVAGGLARTLRAGSKSRTACRPIHPFAHRVITIREAARLHSFPDTTVFPPSTSAAHVAIGNAVPPLMAESLARALVPWIVVRTNSSNAAA